MQQQLTPEEYTQSVILDGKNKHRSIASIQYIVNLTTGEYIQANSLDNRNHKLNKLLKKNTRLTALTKEDIDESRWRKNDKIVIAPKNTINYVIENYSFIYI